MCKISVLGSRKEIWEMSFFLHYWSWAVGVPLKPHESSYPEVYRMIMMTFLWCTLWTFILQFCKNLNYVRFQGGRHSRSPSLVSLSVETALGSFDFLNMSDCEDEEGERKCNNERYTRSRLTQFLNVCKYVDFQEVFYSFIHIFLHRSLPKRGWDSPSSLTAPLTTGCSSLDQSLEAHLKYCSTQLLVNLNIN